MKKRKSLVGILLVVAFLSVFIPANLVFHSKESDNLRLELYESNGTVRLASGGFGATAIRGTDDLYNVMQAVKDTYGIKDARKEFSYDKTLEAPFGYSHKLTQKYDGYPVFGRSVTVATDKNGNVVSISGNYLKDINPHNRIEKSEQEALQSVKKEYAGISVFSNSVAIYSLNNNSAVYAYNVSTDWNNGTRFFVDAQSGSIIDSIATAPNESMPTEPHQTEQIDYHGNPVEVVLEKTVDEGDNGHTYYLADSLRNIYLIDNKSGYEFDGELYSNDTGIFEDRTAITAFLNFIKAFDFYTDPSNIGVSLRGVDNSVNMVHDDAEESDEACVYAYLHFGSQYANAAYMSGAKEDAPKEVLFIFGDGYPSYMFDFASSLDVVAHEYQHAVTAYSADLLYLNASGAINEAYSDIFGALVQGYDLSDDNFWLIGEDIINPSYGYALRDMKDPNALGDPAYYNGSYFENFCYVNHDHYNSSCDNGGVHANSSIVNHAAYSMYELRPDLFEKSLMGTLWYSTLLLLPQDADFSDLRIVMQQAAALLGYSQDVIDTIAAGFDSVGVFGSEGVHTISFDKGTAEGDVPAEISRQYGESFVMPVSGVSKTGYQIFGWSEDGTSNTKIYIEGESYTMVGRNLILRPVFSIAMWNNLSPSTWSGDGSFENPYLIQSEADLATIAYYVNNWSTVESEQNFRFAYFKQTKDLDLQNINWIPIGLNLYRNTLNYMLATYDGGGHCIRNLKIDGNPYDAYGLGLFGRIDFSIKNLGIESGSVKGSAKYVAGLGASLYGTVENCYNKADIENTNENLYVWENFSAGVVADCTGDINNCYNAGNIKGNAVVGGVVALISKKITNCYNTGSVRGGSSTGGIFGMYSYPFAQGIYIDGTLKELSPGAAFVGNCYNTGSIIGQNAGGIAGKTTDVYYANCINVGDISGTTSTSCIGGIVGHASFAQAWLNSGVRSKSEGSMILGCKNTGYIDGLSALHAGGIVGSLFDESDIGYVRYEKNIFKKQGELSDIGNYGVFSNFMKNNFFGERAKSSDSNIFEGEFDFDNAEYYADDSIWATTSWVAKFGIGYEWQITGTNTMPIPDLPEYWTDYRATSFAGGNGTMSAPYKIATAEQLALLSFAVNFNDGEVDGKIVRGSFFILTEDIDLSGKVWIAIGCEYSKWLHGGGAVVGTSENFTGVFDGNGKKIINMYARDYTWYQNDFAFGFDQAATRNSTAPAALFGSVGSNSGIIVRNVIIENPNVLGDVAAAVAARVGMIDSISNCEVIGGSISGFQIAGGIVGVWNGYSSGQSVSQCFNSAKIYGSNAVGGIIGSTEEQSGSVFSMTYDISACVNAGAITNYGNNLPSDPSAAGIIGVAGFGVFDITGCINVGEIANYDYYGIVGGIVGYCRSATVNISNSVQFGEYDYRETVFSTVGALVAVPLLSGMYSIDSSISISDCFFNSVENAVADMPLGFENPTVVLDNAVYSTDLDYFDFSNLDYFKSGEYLGNIDIMIANWMYARLNGKVMLVLYKNGLYSVIFAEVGEQIGCLPHMESEVNGFGGWVIAVSDGYIQLSDSFEIVRDITAFYDKEVPNYFSGEWEPVHHATCQDNGSEKRVCTSCGHEQTRETAALGHDYPLEWIIDTEPDCSHEGSASHQCNRCESTEEKAIPALPHPPSEWIIDVPAIGCEDGHKHKECTVCGEILEEEIIPALPHSPSEWIIDLPASADTDGHKHKECTVCGEILEEEMIPALGTGNEPIVCGCGSVGWSGNGTDWLPPAFLLIGLAACFIIFRRRNAGKNVS